MSAPLPRLVQILYFHVLSDRKRHVASFVAADHKLRFVDATSLRCESRWDILSRRPITACPLLVSGQRWPLRRCQYEFLPCACFRDRYAKGDVGVPLTTNAGITMRRLVTSGWVVGERL